MSAGLRYFVSPTEDLQASHVARSDKRAGTKARTRTFRDAVAYLLAVVAAAVVAYVLSERGPVLWWTVGAIAALLVLEFAALPSYSRATSLRPAKHLVIGGGAALLLAAATDLVDRPQVKALLPIVLTAAGVVVASAALRTLRRKPRTALLVGDETGVSHLVRQWSSSSQIDVRGVCLAQNPGDVRVAQVLGEPVCGDLTDVPATAAELGVDTVVVAPGPVLSAYDVRRLSWALDGSPVELSVASEIHGATPHRITPQMLGRRLLFSVRPGRSPAPAVLAKNVIDRIGAAVLLVLFAPLFALLAVVVRCTSPGPVFFCQERTGLRGAGFQMVKFRTMTVDAEDRLEELQELNEAAGPLFKLTDDPRVTRVGHLLRRTSLDELPQLFNVLRGQMSLIGPRPGLPSETATYDDWIRHRLEVKPGMTGAWQVNGRSKLSWQDSVRLDIDYVDNWTLTSDLAIAGKTARAVLQRDGAN